MRTALITVGDKQQIVLQPENMMEHRVLQMMTQGEKDIQVMVSPFAIIEQGSLRSFNGPEYYQSPSAESRTPTPILVHLQPAMPTPKPVRNPEVLVMEKSELLAAIRMLLGKDRGQDPLNSPQADNILTTATDQASRLLECLEELRTMGQPYTEPNPFL